MDACLFFFIYLFLPKGDRIKLIILGYRVGSHSNGNEKIFSDLLINKNIGGQLPPPASPFPKRNPIKIFRYLFGSALFQSLISYTSKDDKIPTAP